jgi:two-component system, LytTR family, response regulator
MIKAVIIEDEPKSLKTLEMMLSEHCPAVYVAATADSVQSGVDVIQKNKPDLVFLDISLDSENSFEILERLPSVNFQIIFITAYKDYALEAFKVSAIDYLLKPIEVEQLVKAVRKCESKNHLSVLSDQVSMLLERNNESVKRIALPTLNGLSFINISDIVRCEASGSYTNFILRNSKQILASRNIKEYEKMLENYDFYRIHDSHIVNLAYVRHYIKGRGGYVILDDNSQVEVSVRRKNGFLERFS